MSELDPSSAQAKIIHAAGALFADLGFDIVSVREIAAEAGVHFTAINYHFGTKDKLYEAALRTAAVNADVDAYISARRGTLDEPTTQLREIARRFLSEYFQVSEASWATRLLAREMLRPSRFSDLLKEIWEPNLLHVAGLLGEVLGIDPETEEIRFRAGMFFMLLDAVGQSQKLIEAYAGHPVELEWTVDQAMDLFAPEARAGKRP